MVIGYILLFGSMALFLAMLGFLMPTALLRVRYANVQTGDRGLRRCIVNGKRCVLYEVAKAQRKYVRRYVLWQEKGYKLLKCHAASGVRFLEYDVVIYDRYDKIIDVLRAKENLVSVYTRPMQLPDETAYISLRLRHVNKETLDAAALVSIPRRNIVFFALLSLLLIAVESFVVKVGCAYAFGGVFREDFIAAPEGTLIGVGVTLAVALIALLFSLIPLRVRSKK